VAGVTAEPLRLDSKWASLGIAGAGVWVAVVLVITFWRAWDIPTRLPDINQVATIHLFLFPVSLLIFFTLSWIRQQQNQQDVVSAPWRLTVILWVLVLLHPVSCGLYPALFNLDQRTVEGITTVMGTIQVGMPRDQVEQKILELNRALPVSMGVDDTQHDANVDAMAQYLTTTDPEQRYRLRLKMVHATLVFVPTEKGDQAAPTNPRQEVFQRRVRRSSDIGVDRIEIRYGTGDRLEQLVYSSNRQLTEVRAPCTIHFIVPAPPETSFPYPCP
jgi:PII-like signaling protein